MEIAARLRDHFALIHALAASSRWVRGHRGSAPLRGIIDLPGHLAVPLRQREEHRSRTRPERGFRAVHLLVRETQISPGLVGVARHDATQPLRNGMSLPLPAHDREMAAAKTPCCDICAIGGLPHRTRGCECQSRLRSATRRGTSLSQREALSSKRVELLKQAFPRIASVSVLINPKNVSMSLSLSATKEAAGTLGIRFAPLPASTPDELRALSSADLTSSDALTVLPDAMFWNHRATIIALVAAAHLRRSIPSASMRTTAALLPMARTFRTVSVERRAMSIAFCAGPSPQIYLWKNRSSTIWPLTSRQRRRSALRFRRLCLPLPTR
jgi:hypothetical protein